jgi:diol dehydratase reactivase alpha subunit
VDTALVVGVDIGNSTTEVCVAAIVPGRGPEFLGGALTRTTGVKGTRANTAGVRKAVVSALADAGRRLDEVSAVLINEATPVISGLAMETITETIITESTMIGHDPRTPGGLGLGVGITVPLALLDDHAGVGGVIAVVGRGEDFADAAERLDRAVAGGVELTGVIVCADDAVLISNRLSRPVPIVDEIGLIDKVPLGMLAAVEVAEAGRTIRTLANSYGLATVFGLDPEQTRMVSPVARSLVGNRSAVVIRTPAGDISERRIPAGAVELRGASAKLAVGIDEGAEAIMHALERVAPLTDAAGEPGSHVGGMLARVKETMAELTGQPESGVRIRDLLAVDTFVPKEVRGGLAGEFALEQAVGLAAMVRTNESNMADVAAEVAHGLGTEVVIGGVEAEMAVLGGLTTPGTARPIVVLDLGGGSTDAALSTNGNETRTTHVAGAGDLVTRLIDSELGLDDRELAEQIKKNPLAKVESFFHLRLEDSTVQFAERALPASVFAQVVVRSPDGLVPVPTRHPIDRIRQVRREAKRRVFVVNALRALRRVAPHGNVRQIDFVVLLGGSALDFEIPEMISEALADFGIVCGTGNVRGSEGPRNAVASGLVAAYAMKAPVVSP